MNQIGTKANATPLQAAWGCIEPLPLGLASMSPQHTGPHFHDLCLFRDQRRDGLPAALSEIASLLQATEMGRNDRDEQLAAMDSQLYWTLSRACSIAWLGRFNRALHRTLQTTATLEMMATLIAAPLNLGSSNCRGPMRTIVLRPSDGGEEAGTRE